MSDEILSIRYGDTVITDCNSIIIVPERAESEAGYIKTLTVNAHAHSKHEFQAMAQTVYYRYQDDELAVKTVQDGIDIEWQGNHETLDRGILIYRDLNGEFHVMAQAGQRVKKLLEAANRFCTRWVRLDI